MPHVDRIFCIFVVYRTFKCWGCPWEKVVYRLRSCPASLFYRPMPQAVSSYPQSILVQRRSVSATGALAAFTEWKVLGLLLVNPVSESRDKRLHRHCGIHQSRSKVTNSGRYVASLHSFAYLSWHKTSPWIEYNRPREERPSMAAQTADKLEKLNCEVDHF